jgi:hypothetical protein
MHIKKQLPFCKFVAMCNMYLKACTSISEKWRGGRGGLFNENRFEGRGYVYEVDGHYEKDLKI